MAPRKKKPRGTPKRQSKNRYLAHRKQRVWELRRTEGLEPYDIAVRLVKEGTIETTDETLQSAVKLVRGDLADLNSERQGERVLDVAVAGSEVDVLERELAELRKQHARQEMIADGEPIEMCARSRYPLRACANPACLAEGRHVPFTGPAIGISIVDTPQGPMTTFRALWPAGTRQKASKDAAALAERISKLEVVLADKRREAVARQSRVVDPKREAGGFTFNFSGRSLETLLQERVGGNAGKNVVH